MKKTDLKQFDNTFYHPGSMAKRSLWYVVNVLLFEYVFDADFVRFYGFEYVNSDEVVSWCIE